MAKKLLSRSKNKAKELGVEGTVKNLEDGRVEIFARADTAQLELFVKWCGQGPVTARVDHIEIAELDESPVPYESFRIV